MKESHEYRLGNIFLRNFYTALHYDKDLIMIGVNKGSASHASASIEGHTRNPFKPDEEPDNSVAFGALLLVYLMMCTTAFIYFFIEKKKIDRQSSNRNPQLFSQQAAPQI